MPQCLDMYECLNKQDSEYASGAKYAKVLNMAKFWIWQDSQYVSITQCSDYARKCLDRVLNISWVLNMPGFQIWQGSEHAKLHRVLNMPPYGWICQNRTLICLNMSAFTIIDIVLNMYNIIHSMRLLCKLLSTYWEIGIFRTWSKI